jgi:hypothetical protein
MSLPIRLVKNYQWRRHLYLGYFIALAVTVPPVADYLGSPACKYVALITTAYAMARLNHREDPSRHADLPRKTLARIWFEVQFLFYGSAGGELRNGVMTASIKWRAVLILIVGVSTRFVVTFLSTFAEFRTKYSMNLKERVYISMVWCAKAGG